MASREHPTDIADAGLVSERTYLAWQRTGLTFAGVGALLVHLAGGLRHPAAVVPGLVSLGIGAIILLRGVVRYRAMVAAARGAGEADHPRLVAAVAVATVALGVAALVLILTLLRQPRSASRSCSGIGHTLPSARVM